jgi:small subunit ribosomal protein S16
MLKIRLQRVGRKNIRTFRVVLTDSKNSTKSGRVHEILGSFDLENDKKEIVADRIKYWISKGAKTSNTIHNFLVEKKVVSGKKINALPKKTPVKKEVPKTEAEAPKAPETAAVASAA